jgi:hypothetical protein
MKANPVYHQHRNGEEYLVAKLWNPEYIKYCPKHISRLVLRISFTAEYIRHNT